jgi:very-short-patch-repair endonuclease
MATPQTFSNPADRQFLRDALAQLRLRLLDLTGRNRLLNYKHPIGKSLQFVEGQPGVLFERLSEGKSTIAIKGLPEPNRGDWIMAHGRWSRPEPKVWAEQKNIPTTSELPEVSESESEPYVRALMYRDDLAKHCRKIERESILAIEETGANMLYLVLGFLEFPDQKDGDRIFTAPLLCVPVVLSKKEAGGHQQFFLRYTGDDISENLSLREKLRQDHALIMPEFEEEEIDVEAYFSSIKKLIKSRIGFTLRRRVSLCLLSFTNMLLVRDLDPDNWPVHKGSNGLLDHAIVKTVFGQGGSSDYGISSAEEYPVEQEPALSIPLIFDADSSQHSAIVDVVAKQRNVVIEGPPGTGKSQTITNLIAASLVKGQRVLFVSEKLAALQVVRNRLSIAGLDPFILELHSTKTSKKQILEQIGKRIDYRISAPRELGRKLQELDAHRKELKAYADLLNSEANTSFGLTLHELMWKAERHRLRISRGEAVLTEMVISDAREVSGLELARRMQSLDHLSQQYLFIGRFTHEHPFWGFFPRPMVPGDELRLQRMLSGCCELAQRFDANAVSLCSVVGEGLGLTRNEVLFVRDALIHLVESVDERLPLHLVSGFLTLDRSGQTARLKLEKLRDTAHAFHELAEVAQKGLVAENHASHELLIQLRSLRRLRLDVGCAFENSSDLQNLVSSIKQSIERLTLAHQVIRSFCGNRAIPFTATIQGLKSLRSVAQIVCEVPEEHLHVQSEAMTDPLSISAIEQLAAVQNKWTALENDLAQRLYLDHLPGDALLGEVIIMLRQGDAWYRPLQPKWRSAVSLHKKLLRQQLRMQSSDRLNDLHRLVDLRTLKSKWRGDSCWQKYLHVSVPDGPFIFDSHLSVAKWNRAVILAMDAAGVQLFNPATLTPAAGREHRRQFAEIERECRIAISAVEAMLALLPAVDGNQQTIDRLVIETSHIAAELERHIPFLSTAAPSRATLDQVIAGIEAALERKRLADEVEADQPLKQLLKECFLGVNTHADQMLCCLKVAEEINRLSIPQLVRDTLLKANAVLRAKQILPLLDPILTNLDELDKFASEMCSFGDFHLEAWMGRMLSSKLVDLTQRLKERTALSSSRVDTAIPWSVYVGRRAEVKELGLAKFVDLLELEQVAPDELADAYAYSTFASAIREAFRRYPQLDKFSGLKHSKVREEFKRLDREIIQVRGQDVAAQCLKSAAPPYGMNGTRVDDKTEMVLLNYLLPQQRPRMPVRKMLKRAGRAVQELKPCFMMGPQAVAQYLSPGAATFDVIIMDEASQLKPEEAIGAIARGSQLVVVGDPKQLPPTSFFTRMAQVGEDDEQFTTTDIESILDLCLGHFHPARQLRWHYRSQHHSLIAFSNHYFYKNLIVFPSPYGHSSKLGIKAVYISDAVYEDQTNYKEAIRVVDAVIDHIKSRPDESLGVVTLNLKQRDLIAELLEDRIQSLPESESYRERWRSESQPLFIKNLENVQGDERDAIIISTTFGRSAGADAVRQNFGPISRQGGWRRLNVLFTRARKSIALFTSMRPEDIVVDGSTPEGTKTLRNYLEYARTGSLTVAEETGTDPESDFEASVITLLKQKGYEVTPQLGVAGYRIDIAVKHPEYPRTYLAAIECDGAGYHSALSVRDRDRIRQEILESMGWRGRIWRIWSTDWFRSPRNETEKLLSFLDELRKSWKPEHASGHSWIEIGKAGDDIIGSSDRVGDLETVRSALLAFDDDLSVRVGDTVRYFDVKKPQDILTVQITQERTDTTAGLVHRATPLAQALLGAVSGDEVIMHLPGASARTFHIVEVKREPA